MKLHKSTRFWAGLILYVVLLAVVMVALPWYVNAQYPNLKQDDKIDIRVFSNITRTLDPNRVVIKIFGLGGRYKEIAYDMKYRWGDEGYQTGIFANPVDVTGLDDVSLDVYLGSCDGKPCTEKPGPHSLWVLIEYTTLDGKKIQTGTP